MRWHAAGVLLVQDTVSGPPGDWVSRARVHPDWRLVETLDNAVSFRLDDMHLTILVEKQVSIEALDGEFFPSFGMRQQCTVVEMKPGPNRTHARYAVFGRPLNEVIGLDNHLGLETKLGTYGW